MEVVGTIMIKIIRRMMATTWTKYESFHFI